MLDAGDASERAKSGRGAAPARVQGAVELTPAASSEIRQLYESGRFLDAFQKASAVGPIDRWDGTDARILGGRVLQQVGAHRMGRRLLLQAYRRDRSDPDAICYGAYSVFQSHGPLATLRFLRRHGGVDRATPHQRASLLALEGRVLAGFRDFEAATKAIEAALRTAPDDPWILVEQTGVLAAEDRYGEAGETARAALALRTDYPPAVAALGSILAAQHRTEEARDFLAAVGERIQSAYVVMELAQLESALDRHEAAIAAWQRVVALSPAMEQDTFQLATAALSMLHHRLGHLELGVTFGRATGIPVVVKAADATDAGRLTGKRVRLAAPFVRQDHATCVPACLATIAQYWKKTADHVAVAEEICWDGTSAAAERRWAQEHGFVSRELTLDWDVTVALIDRGVPFTLTTMGPTMGHAQVVVGYDSYRKGLLIRDPSAVGLTEIDADLLFAEQAPYGPRGHIVLPPEEGGRLDGLRLPDAEAYDHLFRVDGALQRHARDDAAGALAELVAGTPEHRLVLFGQRALAAYDGDQQGLLRFAEAMLARFPNDTAARRLRLSCLTGLARDSDRRAAIEAYGAGHDAHPLLRLVHAGEQVGDPTRRALAMIELEAIARQIPAEASVHSTLASALWADDRRDEALELFRFASCLRISDEKAAGDYFVAAHHLARADEALAWLGRRAERHVQKASGPTLTFARVLSGLQRASAARAALARGMEARPEDGELLLAAAVAADEAGEGAAADGLLERARGRCHKIEWLRARAQMASRRGERDEAMERWREVLAVERFALDALESLTFGLAAARGWTAAFEHVEAAAGAAPFHVAIHQLAHRVLVDRAPERALALLTAFVQRQPDQSWAHCERALLLAQQAKLEEALDALAKAEARDPTSAITYEVRGKVMSLAGRTHEASAACLEAIARDPDRTMAMVGLIDEAETTTEAAERLTFVRDTLRARVTNGNGIAVYCRLGAEMLPDPEGVLLVATEAVAARPDLWSGWQARIQQLQEMGRLAEAEAAAIAATDRLPLLVEAWLVRAQLHRARRDGAKEQRALERALELRPADVRVLGAWAAFHVRSGDEESASRILERARALSPFDPAVLCEIAQRQFARGLRDAAWKTITYAVDLEPGDGASWDMLWGCANALAMPERAIEIARRLAARAENAAAATLIDRVMELGKVAVEERLTLLRRAVERQPAAFEVRDRLAEVLAEAGRFDEARAVCRDIGGAFPPPIELRGRLAWIRAKQGNPAVAIAEMKEVIAKRVRYLWGHVNCAEWHMALGDATSAIAALTAASEVAPGNVSLGHNLFDLQIGQGQLHRARETLERLAARSRDAGTALRAVQLEVACRRGTEALATLAALGRCESAGEAELNEAMRLLLPISSAADRAAALEPLVGEADVPEAVAAVWVGEVAATVPPAAMWSKLAEIAGRRTAGGAAQPKSGTAAILAYLKWLLQTQQKGTLLRFVDANGPMLRADTVVWGEIGHALLAIGKPRRVLAWLHDWQTKTDLEPWMLTNAAVALEQRDQLERALAVREHALTLPRDHTFALHAVMTAFGRASGGNVAGARTLLEELRDASCPDHVEYWRKLTEAVIAAADTTGEPDPKQRLQRVRQLRDKATGAFPSYRNDRVCSLGHTRAVRSIRRAIGGLRGWLWALGARLD